MLTGLVYALLSAFSFGVSNAWWKKAAIHDDFSRIVFYRGLIAVTLFGLLWLVLYATGTESLLIRVNQAPVSDYLSTVLLCLACSLGLLFFLSSLRYAPVSVSVPLSSINVFSILTAVFILREVFKPVYAVSFLLAGSGVWLLRSKVQNGKEKWNPGATYALLAAFFWGVTYALFKYPARWLGAVPLAFILESCVLFSALLWNILRADKEYAVGRKLTSGSMGHYAFLAFLLFCGTLFFNLAIQLIDVLVLNLTGNLTLITAVLLGWVLLKERIGAKQWLGILLVLLSLLLVQLF